MPYMKSAVGEVFHTDYPEYHKDCENLGSGTKGYTARQAYAREALRKLVKPGATVYGNVESVSRSGMSRIISFYIVEAGRIRNINSLMSDACGISEANGGLKIHGCGMDMIFHEVYSLGRALFPGGFGVEGATSTGKRTRPVTRKGASQAVAKGSVFRGRNGDTSGWDNDGGYALKADRL